MHSDAREALEGVAHTKAPFPHIRRRAAQELWAQKHVDMKLIATQAKEGEILDRGWGNNADFISPLTCPLIRSFLKDGKQSLPCNIVY